MQTRSAKRGTAYLARLQELYGGRTVAGFFRTISAKGASFGVTFGFALYGAESLAGTAYESLAVLSDAGDSGDGGDGGGDD